MLSSKFWFNWPSGFYGNLHHNQFITSFSWKFIKFPSFCIKSYGSLIYSYLCNQCLSPLALWFRIPLRRGVLDTTLCDKVCQWLAAGCSFSLGTPISSTNKTDHHDITEILLKVALNSKTITLPYLLQRSYQNISFVICHKNNSLDTRIHIQLSIKTPSGSDKASTDKGEIINYCEIVWNIAPLCFS